MYEIIISVGMFKDSYEYKLNPSRFFWVAKMRAKIELFKHPHRKAKINKKGK